MFLLRGFGLWRRSSPDDVSLQLCHYNHACASLFCRPSAHCAFVTLVDASASFLASAAHFVLSCGDQFAPAAPSDVQELQRRPVDNPCVCHARLVMK